MLGYMLVAGTYIIVGVMGYFGFMGTFFNTYYANISDPSKAAID